MTDLVPLSERIEYSKALAPSSLLPSQYRGKPENVLVALEYGAALGLSPMAAIQGIHVVEGKPTASAQLIGALVRNAGHRLRVHGDDNRAMAVIVRRDDPDYEFTAEWTMERAKQAGLIGKPVWKQYPAAMLKARAITEVARDACPEVLSGVAYTAEELDHVHAPPAKRVDTGRFSEQKTVTKRLQRVGKSTEIDTETGEIVDGISDENPPENEQIEDAEIIDDEPMADQPEPAAQQDAGEPDDEPITQAQSRKLFACLRALDIADKERGLEMIGDVLGHPVDSTKSLTKSEASMVIDTLDRMAEQQ